MKNTPESIQKEFSAAMPQVKILKARLCPYGYIELVFDSYSGISSLQLKAAVEHPAFISLDISFERKEAILVFSPRL